ncbi:MAG TPA: AAA family ATPase [Candidatus Eisenbacteria bacterium]|nr:AAA family ATPase [Candidatus Eisenbacteria bacterium]
MAQLVGRRIFVGRSAELGRLEALLARAAAGAGTTLVIGGEAGIGKSRLLDRFAKGVGDQARTLEGACLEMEEGGLPFAAITEILREVVRTTPDDRLPALLGPGRAELTRLLPELALRAADLAAHGPESDLSAQARLFELVLGILERISRERPVILAIEDIQWADRSTRKLITFLSRALRDEQVLVILTTRTDERGVDDGTLAFLAELEREEHVERIDLKPFGHDEVAEQVGALTGEAPRAATVERLLARSDGNPFFIEELVLAGATRAASLPVVLRDVLGARIAALSPGAREALRAAAVAGRRIDDGLIATALGRPVGTLGAELREAVDCGILVRAETPSGGEYAFRHGLLHEAVLAELFAGERAALHAAFASALDARVALGDRSVPSTEIARHWDGAGQPALALAPTIAAARVAEAAYAFSEGLRLWDRAAQLFDATPPADRPIGLDQATLLERAAECAEMSGEHERAIDLGRAAIDAVAGDTDPNRVAALRNRLNWYLWDSGDRKGAVAAVSEALTTLPASGHGTAHARALAQHAGILMAAGDFEGSRRAALDAIQLGKRLGARGEVALALGILGWDRAILGDVDAGIADFREGARIAEELGSIEGMALAATNLAALLDRVGRSAESLEAARAGYALTERLGVARTYGGLLLGYVAKAELALGRWDDADASTTAGLRRTTSDRAELWLLVNRARLLTGRGRFPDAAALLARGRAIDARLADSDFHTALLAAEAELAMWLTRVDDAWRLGEEGLGMLRDGPADPSLAWLASLVIRAQADALDRLPPHDRTGRREVLEARVNRIVAAVGRVSGVHRVLPAGRSRAMQRLLDLERARLQGPNDPAGWGDLAAEWRALDRPYQLAYARYREAEALLAAGGPRARAAALLREAADVADELGAQPLAAVVGQLAARARLELKPEGAHARRDSSAGDRSGYDFTPRETDVLRLVAGGWTNQQIADALFITRKTASVHVSNILSKVGVAHRGEAAALAVRLGLVSEPPAPIPPSAEGSA